MPPENSSISSRAVTPAGASFTPGLAHPAGDARSAAALAPAPAHGRRSRGAAALQDFAQHHSVSTLWIKRRPAEQAHLRGKGGLWRG